MKIYLRGELIDTEKEPVIMIFEDDEDRETHANNISLMEPKDAVRLYSIFPESTSFYEMRAVINQAKQKNEEQ